MPRRLKTKRKSSVKDKPRRSNLRPGRRGEVGTALTFEEWTVRRKKKMF